jgi:hypothetical protein
LLQHQGNFQQKSHWQLKLHCASPFHRTYISLARKFSWIFFCSVFLWGSRRNLKNGPQLTELLGICIHYICLPQFWWAIPFDFWGFPKDARLDLKGPNVQVVNSKFWGMQEMRVALIQVTFTATVLQGILIVIRAIQSLSESRSKPQVM